MLVKVQPSLGGASSKSRIRFRAKIYLEILLPDQKWSEKMSTATLFFQSTFNWIERPSQEEVPL